MPLDHASLSKREDLIDAFEHARRMSEDLAAPFTTEDWMIQSMEEASPIKWNLAHTSWFYETFLLAPYGDNYRPFHSDYGFLFNSYYNQVGEMHARPNRGMISRPTCEEVLVYRRAVTDAVATLLRHCSTVKLKEIEGLIALGCAHEEQHQELLLTDIKHGLAQNPIEPSVYGQDKTAPGDADAYKETSSGGWTYFDRASVEIGHRGDGFAFDNEGPAHHVHLRPYGLATRPVTNRDYLQFMGDGGYTDPRWWFSDGWEWVCTEKWSAPLYWREDAKGWSRYTLGGRVPLDLDAPVCHLSYYEAAAFAEWSGFRLPTEAEWENAAVSTSRHGHFLTGGQLAEPTAPEPAAAQSPGGQSAEGLSQLFGSVWEWTASPYVAYPGYRTPKGAIGEYNGKFMSSQMVLRGGSCATPQGHIRATYRNFFPPSARWQFAGLRLARDPD
ncbi:MAG: ergothioneine biosynthesis protein EgtB [Pseudomonadota bacterium]